MAHDDATTAPPLVERGAVRIALIGAGSMGQKHLAALRTLAKAGEAALAAIVDPRARAAELAAAAVPDLDSVPRFESLAALRRSKEIAFDAAVVATPSATHRALGEELLADDSHVLMEKPLGGSLADAEALAALAARSRAHFFVGFVERFNPAVNALQSMLRSRSVAKVTEIECVRSTNRVDSSRDAREMALDLAIHDVDLLHWLLGRWASGSASLERASATFRLAGEASVSARIAVGLAVEGAARAMRLRTTEGDWICDFQRRSLVAPDGSERVATPIDDDDPLTAQLRAFVRAVGGGVIDERLADASAALAAQRTLDGCFR
jgi:predicted dehydrogenase